MLPAAVPTKRSVLSDLCRGVPSYMNSLISDPKHSLFFFLQPNKAGFFLNQEATQYNQWRSRQEDDVILLRMLQRSVHVKASLK